MFTLQIFSIAMNMLHLQSSFAKSPNHMEIINETAPVVCRKTIRINADLQTVWSVLTDIDRWDNWQTDIKKPKLNGNLQVGSTFDWKTGGAKIHSTLHTVEPQSHFGWTGKSLGLFAIHNWTLTEKDGDVHVLVEESMEGSLAVLFKKTFNKNLENGMIRWLEMLKVECEKS